VNTDQLLDIIGDIYEAAADAGMWPRVLQKIADSTHATLVGLPHLDNLDSPRFGVIAAVGLHKDFAEEYPKFAHLNPYRLFSGYT